MLLFAACTAAFAAHYAVDWAGDWLLPRDAYDDLPHDSRTIAFAAAVALAIGVLIATFRAALSQARGDANALRDVLAASLPVRPLAFVALTILATLPLLAAMGALDDGLAARAPSSLEGLFGGSLALGAGVAALCALTIGAVLSLFARALAGAHDSLVRAIVAFVRALRARDAMRFAGRRRRSVTRAVAALLSRRAAGRAPPRAAIV